ncbi:tripartite tricarboxylate transporter substrate binding protein [Hydrogenophaga sp. OTU3427]|uniref:tripartite tricarboxylate transporter substrate binding protein n=1 Tax=Hydrogenophaga sp. OTU3427 TaxID=3043856 RepID=UPI00313B65E5
MRQLLTHLSLLAAALSLPVSAMAQGDGEARLPAVMKIVVPFGPGASNDAIARAIAPGLARRLGNTVIVENKAGASGVIGADFVAKSPRDGSVLLLTSSTFVTAAATQTRLPYDPLSAFAPVAMVGNGPLLVAVSTTTAIRSPADLQAAARSRPGKLTYGSSGIGSIAHLASEMISDAARIQMLHVPYKGAANALMDMAGGQIDMMVSNYSSLAPQIKGGKVRAIAVTSQQPSPAFADLPPMASVAPGFVADIWVAILAPAGTPTAVVQRLNREITEIAATPEVRALLEPDGATPTPYGPAEVAQRIKDDLVRWKQIATDKKIVAE